MNTPNVQTNNKIAAVVVAYNPQPEALQRNVKAMLSAVDKVAIWWNSAPQPELFSNNEKVVMMGSGENHYIARPLNEVLQWCLENGYDHLLTMDQDSTWDDCAGFVQAALADNDPSVAIYSPNMNNQHDRSEAVRDVETVITSGSLTNVRIAQSIGGWREDYQIYWVDGEFCYRARINGYKVRMLTHHNMVHELGHQTRTLFGFYASNYSPIVYYFLIRNMLWMHREYGNKAVSMKCILYTLLFTTRGIILGEKQKCRKLSKICRALWEGMTARIKSIK